MDEIKSISEKVHYRKCYNTNCTNKLRKRSSQFTASMARGLISSVGGVRAPARPRAPVKYSGGLRHDLRSPRKEVQIVNHRTTAQVEQVLALSTVAGALALPMPDVRQIV